MQLALPSSPPAVAMRTGIGWVVETLRSSTTVGAYRLFLTDGETAQEISTADAEALRSLAKQLLQAWHTQQAATNWMIQQQSPGLEP